jgi:hydroxymethylglutaryl-CoA synthase
MVGIISYGAYVPLYRLQREKISQVWGNPLAQGEKAVANWDEDSLTMAVEAAVDCTKWKGHDSIDGLYFASTTSPYREKESASILATILGLKKEILTADFANSLRAGTAAIRAALNAVKSGSAKRVLVVASDCRQPAPDSSLEATIGDGAAAFLIGDSETAADITDIYSVSSDFIDNWKRDEDIYLRTWEERFASLGYLDIVRDSVAELLKKKNMSPKDFNRVVLYGPENRRHRELVQTLGFDMKTQVQDPMFDSIGNTGSAFAPMMLVAALEKAQQGDKILVLNYGDGCDAFILQVGAIINTLKDRRGIARHLQSKMLIPSYGRYLKFRNLMEWEKTVETELTQYSSLPILWRDRKQVLQFMGRKCHQCGHVQIDFPVQRVCAWCQTKDDFEDFLLADKKGTLFTFAWDERTTDLDTPGVLGVVDFQDGCRFRSKVTDRDPQKLKIGMPMELTFRRLHEGRGIHNYFWKVRPLRCEI